MARESHGSYTIAMQPCEAFSPLALADGSACGPDLMRIVDGGYVSDTDGREGRLGLTWTVYLLRSTDAYPLETKTTNVSNKGFYCFVPEAFVVGECIRCTMMIPSFEAKRSKDHIALDCQATVIRVDPIDSSKYGLACHIDHYRIVTPDMRREV